MDNPPNLPPQQDPLSQQPQQQGFDYSHGASQHQEPSTSGLAIGSLICGILGFVTCVTAIPAVIMGHIAQSNIKKSKGMVSGGGMALAGIITGYIMIGMGFVAAPLAAISSPIIIRQIAKSRATQAVNNSKDIYIGLRECAFEKGGLPGEEGDGKSANEHLRQLFVNGFVQDESPFYVEGITWAWQPDNFVEGESALASGENVFGYIPGADIHQGDPARPLLIAPLALKNGEAVIDQTAFGSQVVILRADGSAGVLSVDMLGNIESTYGGYGSYQFNDGVLTYTNGITGEQEDLQVALPEGMFSSDF